jgi:predicted phosphodiesterase
MDVPQGDILIHCGDFTSIGRSHEIEAFIHWFGKQPHKYKIMIAGNHDFGMSNNQDQFNKWVSRRYLPESEVGTLRDLRSVKEKALELIKNKSIILLESSGVEIEGIKIYGSPYQPEFGGWAFNLPRKSKEIKEEWEKIPKDTNILITHGPPHRILDQCQDGFRAGCEELSRAIDTLPDLKLHLFGHIHEDRGIVKRGRVTFVNASSLDLQYQPYPQTSFEIDYEDL